MKSSPGLWRRIVIGAGLPAIILLALYYVVYVKNGLQCMFYEATGLYCPGCGSGRAVYALTQGRIREAFSYNILLLPLGLPSAGIVLWEYVRLVFPGLGLKPVQLSEPVVTGCAAVIIGFWILRNIPAFSFLAPAG